MIVTRINRWGPNEHLLATLIDAINIGNWQRQADRTKPRPKPLPRPTDQVAAKPAGVPLQKARQLLGF